MNFKACRGSRCRDQVHHNLERLERNAPPVSGDVAEQAVFDLVPFAGARRIVADLDSEASLVGKSLEFETPQPCSWAVAPAAVSGNQKPRGVRESLLPQPLPPQQNRSGRELRRVVTDSDTDKRFVVLQVVHAIRNRFAEFSVREVVRFDFDWIFRASIDTAGILQISENFFLFRVDRDRGLAPFALPLDTAGDELELSVAIWVLFAFDGLAVGLCLTFILRRLNNLPLYLYGLVCYGAL